MIATNAAQAASIQALKASGSIVRIEPQAFVQLARKAQDPLVVRAPAGFLGGSHAYMMPYRGLTFYTKSKVLLDLPRTAEIIEAGSIWMPA